MDLGLKDKVAWVLGASSGLGRATARALAAEGASVAISARRTELLETQARELATISRSDAMAVPLDVSDHAAIGGAASSIRERLGPIDILVSNAGGPPPGTLSTLDDDKLTTGFDLTTASAWHLTRAVVPDMKERGRGVIVFVTSYSTKEVIPTLLLSNMMRAAVVGFAKTISKELGPHGIRVLCAAPGRMGTDRMVELDELTAQRSGESVEEVRARSVGEIPLGRYGRPEEFGEVVAFLTSERASYMSGVTVLIDGGLLNGILS